jgi:pimeloyl-ACP methyl ester carboxylesterase
MLWVALAVAQPLAYRVVSHAEVTVAEFRSCRRCPVLLWLPGGAQNRNLMEETLRPWIADARRDWRVVAPFVPDGATPLYRRPDALVPLLEALAAEGPVTVFGVSNGGITALDLAALRPELVASVQVAPGYLSRGRSPAALAAVPVRLVVGGDDAWAPRVAETASDLAGGDVDLVVLPGVGHALHGLPWRDVGPPPP